MTWALALQVYSAIQLSVLVGINVFRLWEEKRQ